MSSILEALKELEASKSPLAEGTGSGTEEWNGLRRTAEVLGIVAVGLVIGAAVFMLFVWLLGPATVDDVMTSEAATPAAPAPRAVPQPDSLAPAPPAWLARAEPPRGRIGAGAAGPAARAPSQGWAPPVESAPAEGAAPREARGAADPSLDDVALAGIAYSADPGRRTVTLQVGGRAATLREGQSAGGVEVQLILPDAVYVRRGAEVLMLTPGG